MRKNMDKSKAWDIKVFSELMKSNKKQAFQYRKDTLGVELPEEYCKNTPKTAKSSKETVSNDTTKTSDDQTIKTENKLTLEYFENIKNFGKLKKEAKKELDLEIDNSIKKVELMDMIKKAL